MTQQYQSAVIELRTADRAAFIIILTGCCKIFLQVNEVFKWRLKENLLSSFTIASLFFALFLFFDFLLLLLRRLTSVIYFLMSALVCFSIMLLKDC